MTFTEVLIAILQPQSTWVSLNRDSELHPRDGLNQIIKSYSLGDPTQRISDLFATESVLDLSNQRLPVAAWKTIAEALKSNTSIHFVFLNNQIGDDGATAIAEALKSNTSIGRVILNNNQIGDDGASAIAESLDSYGSNCFVDLQNNQIGNLIHSQIILQ